MKRFAYAVVGAVLVVAGLAQAETAISVMPLGDSITAGTTPGGYRKPLVEKLTTKYGLTVTTVGTQIDKALDEGHQAHEGHGGWRIDQLSDNLLGVTTTDDGAHGGYWLKGEHDTGREAIHPQIITVMAGINDINQFIGNDKTSPMSGRSDKIIKTLQERQTKLVETLTTNLPDSTILVAGCIPYANGLISDQLTGANKQNREKWGKEDGVSEKQENGVNHWVILFNKWIKDTYVPELQKSGKKVYFVDLYADFILPDGSVRGWNNKPPENTAGPAGYGDYGLHPNEFGYHLIGETLADAIHEHLKASPAAK
ncbi:MAG: lysophospholipase L1-like esterase [Phycisphaerales bacterium]|nr:lysophospholipase L1-like esterase [Phycisphaerales bacterium]